MIPRQGAGWAGSVPRWVGRTFQFEEIGTRVHATIKTRASHARFSSTPTRRSWTRFRDGERRMTSEMAAHRTHRAGDPHRPHPPGRLRSAPRHRRRPQRSPTPALHRTMPSLWPFSLGLGFRRDRCDQSPGSVAGRPQTEAIHQTGHVRHSNGGTLGRAFQALFSGGGERILEPSRSPLFTLPQRPQGWALSMS